MTEENRHADPAMVAVHSGTPAQVRAWSLVLASQAVPHLFVQNDANIWEIQVAEAYLYAATQQILLYEQENAPRTETLALPPLTLSLQPLWILLVPSIISVLSAEFFVLRAAGNNQAAAVLQGQWFRTITAQTLHANSHHLASNLISGYFILSLLASRINLTRLATPILLTSALANFGVAVTWKSNFSSLGFSTFVFAALGAMASIEWRLLPPHTIGVFKRFEAFFSSLFIAIMMGLGENSDILAHFYGLFLGMLTGLILPRTWLHPRPWGAPDIGGALTFVALIAWAWGRALW